MEPTIAELQAKLLAERQAMLQELGLVEPATLPAVKRNSTARRSTRSSEKRRRAAIRSTVKLAKARATGKRRQRLGANLKLLEEAGKLHPHLKRGAYLTGVEGVGYQGKSDRRSKTPTSVGI